MYYDIEIIKHTITTDEFGKLITEQRNQDSNTLPDWAIKGMLESIGLQIYDDTRKYPFKKGGDTFTTKLKEGTPYKWEQFFVEYKLATKED